MFSVIATINGFYNVRKVSTLLTKFYPTNYRFSTRFCTANYRFSTRFCTANYQCFSIFLIRVHNRYSRLPHRYERSLKQTQHLFLRDIYELFLRDVYAQLAGISQPFDMFELFKKDITNNVAGHKKGMNLFRYLQ